MEKNSLITKKTNVSFNNTQIIRGLSIVICLGFLIPGLILIKFEVLRTIFPDIALNQPDVLWRIHYVQVFFFIGGYSVLFLGWLITKIPRFNALPEGYMGFIVSLALTVYLIVSLEAIAITRYKPDYFPEDPNVAARATGATFLQDDFYGHILNPDSKTPYLINSLGFRGEEFPLHKEENEFRVVAMGDSITFGYRLEDETITYPYYLQQLLQAQNSDDHLYRVINAGVPSYDSFQVLRTLENRILDLEPDLIIVMVGWNDLSYSLRPDWYSKISLSTGKKPTFTPALLQMVRGFLPPEPDLDTVLLTGMPDPKALEAYRQNLEKIIDLAENHKIKVILTNLPTILSTQGNTSEELAKAELFPKVENVLVFAGVIDQVCAKRMNENVLCVRNIFNLEENNKDPYFVDHCHPTSQGNYMIAQKLLDTIQSIEK
jgi:lysophospholipase L1-like esterase